MEVLRGNPYCRNPQRIILIGRVVFPMSTPYKKIVLFPMLLGGREVRNDRSGNGPLEIYKKPFKASFTLKRSSSRAILGTPRPLSLKKTKRPTKTPRKLRESWDGNTLKCYRTLLMKGCKGKRRPFSKAASKK